MRLGFAASELRPDTGERSAEEILPDPPRWRACVRMIVRNADTHDALRGIRIAEEGIPSPYEQPAELGVLLELQPLDIQEFAPSSSRPSTLKRRIATKRSSRCLDSFRRGCEANAALRCNVSEEPRFNVHEQMRRASEGDSSVHDLRPVMRVEEAVGVLGSEEMQVCDHGSTFRAQRAPPNVRCASSIGTQTGPSTTCSGQTHQTPTVSALRRSVASSGSRTPVANARW